ncbi:MAG TPA: M61 family peptidase [Candidatus Dormibacteraeota bacterium]|jgi:predicted metalloprotease with PDZ domain|nr:M61 family peptidase [Candidatus Dormibacteraeota bacterium]
MNRAMRAGVLVVMGALVACAEAAAQQDGKAVKLEVDLREAARRVYHSKMEFAVTPGPLTLVYPKWIPGEHAPNGPIVDVTGVKFFANGKEVSWRRDTVDMYAFACEVPTGTEKLEVTLDYLLPTESGTAGVASSSAQIAELPWNLVVLYPKDTKSDDVKFSAKLKIPAGWKFATALPVRKETNEGIEFETVSLTTLVDSPVLAGAHMNTYDLTPGKIPAHRLNTAADSAAMAEAPPEQITILRQLVAETGALFGARHYRHYDFLLALTDHLQPNGLEHHESSDNRVPERTLHDLDLMETQMDLLPHEFFHSWNGKFRRPAGLATSNYQEPMRDELLWIYEGLTQYYGVILATRSGGWKTEGLHEYLAATFAALNDRPGRTWRDLEDTAISSQLLYTARTEGSSWRRPVDYYEESELIWLDADTLIREMTKGKKSLDDFCRAFHGGEGSEPRLVPYTLDDVVATLNGIAANDWKKFFEERIHSHGPGAPLAGLERSGWKIVFNSTMNEHAKSEEEAGHVIDTEFSLGFSAHYPGGENADEIADVVMGSPAAKAGLAAGMKLVAVNGRKWTPDILREAIRGAKSGKGPIELLVENDDFYQTVKIDWHEGERYPHLEAIAGKTDVLAEIAKAKAPATR